MQKERKMKKSLIIMLALFVALSAMLISCASKAPEVETVDLGLEFKNKTGIDATGLYLYPAGSEDKGINIIEAYGIEGGLWKAGKGGVYICCHLIRPVADVYTVELVYADGTPSLLIPAELLKADGDGFLPNMISIKDAADPDLCKIEYESDQEDLDNIAKGPYL